jgi:HD superfamily phosphohydrolase
MKIFNDPIHGHIQLETVEIQVIDTPQFQRLRDLKQMGVSYYVFPGATHNRFEHSIGVCHLAGLWVEMLQRTQPALNLMDNDIKCVRLAGLCHDLGHGPFSHLFDTHISSLVDSKWCHENTSEIMLDYLVKDNPDININQTEVIY